MRTVAAFGGENKEIERQVILNVCCVPKFHKSIQFPDFSSSCTKWQIHWHLEQHGEQQEGVYCSRWFNQSAFKKSRVMFWVLIFPCGSCFIDQGGLELVVSCFGHLSTRMKGACYHTQYSILWGMVFRKLRKASNLFRTLVIQKRTHCTSCQPSAAFSVFKEKPTQRRNAKDKENSENKTKPDTLKSFQA